MKLHNTYDPEVIFDALEQAAEEKAEAEYNAHLLERNGEILLGQLMWHAKQEERCPASLCKELARTKDEWATHVKGEAVAIKARSRARARYENLKILAEARRTQEASARYLTK